MNDQELYEQLAEGINAKGSEIITKIFRKLATPEEARLLLAASPPKSAAELAVELGMVEEKVEEMATNLFQRGLMFKSKKPGAKRYYRVRNAMQFHDATVLWPDIPKDLLDDWLEYTEKDMSKFLKSIPKHPDQALGRVLPIDVAVYKHNKILASEDCRSYIENARSIAVTKCTCRVIGRKCDNPLEVCLQLDKGADYAIDRGTGRAVTKEEAMEIIRKSEEAGLVHKMDNRTTDIYMLCNCCKCCCVDWSSAEACSIPVAGPSRFRAKVDPELCNACGTCVDRCLFDAVQLAEGDSETAEIDPEECHGCGNCVITCPEEAIVLEEIRKPDFIPDHAPGVFS
ncbi:ATP-binding protein [Thermodesulfobacteriota bacterium]